MYDILHMPQYIEIGYTGETNFRTIQIDLSGWLEVMPNGVPSIVHILPGKSQEEAYIVATTFADGILTWNVNASDIGDTEGTGLAQVWLEEAANNTLNKRGMSAVFATLVRQSVSDMNTDVPEPQIPWLQQMTQLKTETVNANIEAGKSELAAKAAQALSEEWATGGSGGTPSASNNAKAYALKAEGYAVGKQNGEAVESGDYFHNNAEYYADQADDSAQTASGKAGEAAGSAVAAAGSASEASSSASAASGSAGDAASSASAASSSAAEALVSAGNASSSASTAQGYAGDAESSAELAHQWATYGDDDEPGEENNAAYWADQAAESAEHAADAVQEAIDDTAGDGDTDKLWSANKIYDELALKAPKTNPNFTGNSFGMNRYDTPGYASVAMGDNPTASGDWAVSLGYMNEAAGEGSFAKNIGTWADGYGSDTSGIGTIAKHKAQHVFGQYNESTYEDESDDPTDPGTYIEMVGNGTSSNSSNARALDWNGNEKLAGDIFINCNDDSTGGTALGAEVAGVKSSIGTVPSGKTVEGQISDIEDQIEAVEDSIGTVPTGHTVMGDISDVEETVMGIFNHATEYTPSNDPMFFYGTWYHEVGTSYIARLNDSHAPADPELVSVWQVMGDAPYHIPSSSDSNWLVYTIPDAVKHINDFQNNIADVFYSGVVYEEGHYASRDGVTYKRKSWGSTTPVAKAWSASDWEKVEVANDLNEKIDSECSDLKSAISGIQNYGWENGFIQTGGSIDGTSYDDRKYSTYLPCPANTSVTYIGETAHSTILGISFYDKNKAFISGVSNNGTNGEPKTVTSPNKTAYCRISTKTSYLEKTYYIPGTGAINYINDDVITIKNDISNAKNSLNSIEKFAWSYGFVDTTGNISGSSYTDRQHSEYMVCPENTSITYIAETKHASVLGISFYDKDKAFISGVSNNGNNGEPQTTTSPEGTRYCRLSTRSEYVSSSYYLPAIQALDYTTKIAYNNKNDIKTLQNGYILFTKSSSTRATANSIAGLLTAKVINNSYDIALYYKTAGGSTTNTGWVKAVRLSDYKEPQMIEIRKSNNSALNSDEINKVVIGVYMAGLAQNGYVYKETGVAYVDGTDGSDTNDGLNQSTAFATIQKAIDNGFKKILVRAGTYSGGIFLQRENGYHIMLNHAYSSFDESTANTNPKIILDCDNTDNYGLNLYYCSNCIFEDIEIENAVNDGVNAVCCENLEFINCVVHDCPGGNGYSFRNSNADLFNCGCYNIGTMGGGQHHDGFNISQTGIVNFTNCWANYCEDDGISHHDACEGFVDGGEWHHCGKAGVATPTHGAKVNVQNVYAHDCNYGIYAGNETASLAKIFNITNCVCKNNAVKDVYVQNNTANIWNCIYDTIQHDGTGTNNVLN